MSSPISFGERRYSPGVLATARSMTPAPSVPLPDPADWLPRHTVALWLIVATAVASRVLLALYNRSANDDHMEVIQRIVAGGRPLVDDCWQCYQPKLYHQFVADVIPTEAQGPQLGANQ